MLLAGEFREGDRLPTERELALRLEVSRPTVREALSLMIQSGLLVARQGSGTFVAPVDLEETMEMRRALEPLAAEHAARRRDAVDVATMRTEVQRMRAAVDHPAAFAEADVRVHVLVRKAARHALLGGVLERLDTLTRLSRSVTSSQQSMRRSALAQLEALVDAIDDEDPASARRHMIAHLEDVAAALGCEPEESSAR